LVVNLAKSAMKFLFYVKVRKGVKWCKLRKVSGDEVTKGVHFVVILQPYVKTTPNFLSQREIGM